MKILITGASGFIGSFLVEEALQKGWEVWAGIRETSNRRYLTHPDLHFIDLRYDDFVAMSQQIKLHTLQYGVWDYVIHNAGVTKCINEQDYDRINHQYTVHLVQALLENNSLPTKFLLMSSMGAVGPGDERNGAPIRLIDKPNPISAYGKSKLMAEDYVRSHSEVPWIILRPTGVYGPREQDYYIMIKMIRSGLDVSVGFKQQMLSFIYVKDLARVCILTLESSYIHKTWFVADGDVYSSSHFAKLIQSILLRKIVLSIRFPLFLVRIISEIMSLFSKVSGKPSLINADKYKVMKQRNWTCDVSDLTRDLSFKSSYNLQKGMEETIAWYKKSGWL